MSAEYVSIGFVSNDHLAVLPFIPLDTKVKILSHVITGGGPAGNAAAGAAAMGMASAFIGTVGDDADGRMILEEYAREGVDTSLVAVRPGATSAIAYLWIDEKTGARSCAWTREGLNELDASEIEGDERAVAAIRGAKILHLDGHNAAGAIAAAKIAKAAGVTVMYDAGTHRDGEEELLALADLIVCSEEFVVRWWREAKVKGEEGKTASVQQQEKTASVRQQEKTASVQQQDVSDVEVAVRAMWEKYRPKVCGATMGVNGSVCFDGEKMVRCPAFKVEKVVDTTGCGDLFHVGFAVKWLETHDLMACQRFGAAVSALKCRGIGGRPPVAPTRVEVEEWLKTASVRQQEKTASVQQQEKTASVRQQEKTASVQQQEKTASVQQQERGVYV